MEPSARILCSTLAQLPVSCPWDAFPRQWKLDLPKEVAALIARVDDYTGGWLTAVRSTMAAVTDKVREVVREVVWGSSQGPWVHPKSPKCTHVLADTMGVSS